MKKIICLILAFVLAFGAVPVEATDFEKITEIKDDMLQQALYIIPEGFSDIDFLAPNASYTAPETVTVEKAQERLQEFIEKFEGKFFTVDGNYCPVSGIHASSCSNCLMSNVIAAEWVEELVGMGKLDASLCPTQYSYKGSQGFSDGYQCFGFANFAHWYIFAQKNTDKVSSTLEATGPLTYETIKNALPGDVLRSNYYGGHSMIFISCDEEGFNVIDSNHTGNADGKSACIVKVHKVKYNPKYTVAITGVKNYERKNGETSESLSMQYDDRYDVSGKTVEIVDAGKPTSQKVGYGVAEGILDDAVITLSGEKLVATGIGSAKVRIDRVLYEITVEAAPISLLLLIGQSNMEGMVGNANQSIANVDGQVYSTYAMANGLTGDAGLTVENAGNYVPSALTGEYSAVNVNGNNTKLSGYPVNSLTESGSGKYGMDSGIAYEWVKQTGEKVWVVNAAHGASSISSWQKGESNYEEAVALLSTCQEVLKKEIAAGHYTFSHMGYYWCQGCADEQQTAKWYAEKYIAMHDNLKAELAFDADLDENTENTTFEFGNIILVMAGHETATGYRKGIYEDDSDKFFATFKELEMRGPRVAQIWLANNPELEDIYIVSTIAQEWITMPDGSDGVEEYFASHYEKGTIDYPTQVKQKESWYSPKKPAEVKNSIHYYQVGYNEVGRESVRNTMYILGIKEKPDVETTVTFYDWTGYKEIAEIQTVSKGISETLAVPFVYPCYESKNVTYNTSKNLEYFYYDLLDKESKGGVLSDSLGQNEITAVERETYSYRFELSEGEMVSIDGGVFTGNPLNRADRTHKYYKATTPIILRHDKEWVVEFFSEQGERFIALSCQGWFSSKTEYSDNAYFIFKRTDSGKSIISFGEYKNQQYEYWGIKQGMADVDWDLPHVYSFRNVIKEDGSNIIHIYIDDVFVGTTANRIINNVVTATDESYFSRKDFLFPFIGAGGTLALNSDQMIWMNVWENGHTHSCTFVTVPPTCTVMGYTDYTCSICGTSYIGDYVEATGHSYENGICNICGEWEYPIGDINLDGSVDVKDSYYIRLVVAKLRKPTEQQILLGDVDLDGKITAIDANIIRKYILGNITEIPVE